MTRRELEHAIRAACDVSNEDEVIVFGSQAILGQYPDAPAALRQSMEADIAPGSGDPAAADLIDGSLGAGSAFHQTHGFYVHGLTIDAATFPKGWERRTVVVRGGEPTIIRGCASRRTTWPRASSPHFETRTGNLYAPSWRSVSSARTS